MARPGRVEFTLSLDRRRSDGLRLHIPCNCDAFGIFDLVSEIVRSPIGRLPVPRGYDQTFIPAKRRSGHGSRTN